MLVVTRKKDEKLMIGDDIEVQVLRIGRENVRLGIKAPANVSIYRQEIYQAIQQREAAAASEDAPKAQNSEAAVSAAASTASTASEASGDEVESTDSPRVRAHSEG